MKLITKLLLAGVAGYGVYYIYKKTIAMKVSSKGLDFIMKEEGIRNKMYLDSVGKPTIGVGHLILPTEKHLLTKTLTDLEVKNLFKKDIDRFEKAVNDSILIPMSQHQFDSLVSLAFNIGESGFKRSSLSKWINARMTNDEIIKAFSMWKNPPVLINRRAREARLYLTGNYSPQLASLDLNKYFKA
jgi:lysozyme